MINEGTAARASSGILGLAKNLMSSRLQRARDRHRRLVRQHDEIYAPLAALLLDCHVTTVTSRRYPHFSQRLRVALRRLRNRGWRDPWVRRIALKSLFDKGTRTSREVEFGSFPLVDINRTVARRIRLADAELLDRMAAADRSRYERQGGELTEEEYRLFMHIYDRHRRLNNMLCK